MKKKQSFISGAVVMAVASVLCKIMGAVFKIPLDRFFLHEDGIAVFQSAYSIYNVFLAVFVTGIPIALSSLVAQADDESADSLRRSALISVSAFCAFSAAILFFGAEKTASLLTGKDGGAPASASIRMFVPALLVMGIISSTRGYFQGRGEMLPSAISQFCESSMKAVLGTVICYFTVKGGIVLGSAGAMGGVTIGALLSAAVLLVFLKRTPHGKGAFSWKLTGDIIKRALPVTLGAFGFTAVIVTDTFTVQNILAASGVSSDLRLKLFGYLTRANMIYNLPATIITAVTASAVPAIATACFEKNDTLLRENVKNALKLIFLTAIPCAFGLIFFSPQILSLIYSNCAYSELLAFTGILVIIMPYIQATTGMLQALGSIWQPILASAVAVIFKIIFNFIFIKCLGISGAVISTIAAFSIALVINTVLLRREIKIEGFSPIFLKILISGVASCTLARGFYEINKGTLMLLASIFMAALLFALFLVVSKAVTKEDIKQFRGDR